MDLLGPPGLPLALGALVFALAVASLVRWRPS